jgi:hypothetical protein
MGGSHDFRRPSLSNCIIGINIPLTGSYSFFFNMLYVIVKCANYCTVFPYTVSTEIKFKSLVTFVPF